MKKDYHFDPAKPWLFPAEYVSVLSAHQMDQPSLFISTDRSGEGLPCNCLLAADKSRLLVICGVMSLRKERKNTAKKAIVRYFVQTEYTEYSLSELSDFSLRELASSCLFTAEKDGERLALAGLNLGLHEPMLHFVDYIKELKEKGTFTPVSEEEAKEQEQYCPKCGLRYADADNKLCLNCRKKGSVVWRTASLFKEYRLRLFLVLVLLILAGALSVLAPYFSTKTLYDDVLVKSGKYYGKLLAVILMILGTRLLSMLVSALQTILTSTLAADMTCKLRRVIFSSINRLSLGFFTSRKTGGLMTQVNSDAGTIYGFFCDILPAFAVNIVQVLAVLVVMFLLNPLLCVAAVILVPLSIVAIRFIYRKLDLLHYRRFGKSRSLNSSLSDMLSGARVVKAFSGEEDEKKRFDKKSQAVANADLETSEYEATVFPAVGLLLHLGSVFVWALGGVMILLNYRYPSFISDGAVLTYGTLATFLSYVSMIYSPLFFFVNMVSMTADSMNAMGRLIEIMDAKPEVVESAKPLSPETVSGRVTFEDVGFSYTVGHPVLKNISFDLPAGKTLGIVGKTGAGKSTLANLLIRLYDPSEGRILLDGVDLKDLSFEYLRNSISIVSQDTYLFSGTVLENVRYANNNASLEEVLYACVASGAHDFIMKLPDGYDTKIGQGNADLSGGERQRLSIARAILKNPKILILDEATAAMDTRTEQLIQRSITALSKGRTTLIIAHRLSTLRDADELIVLDKKTVVERGTPQELLRQKGEYFKLYKLQLEALRTIGISEED